MFARSEVHDCVCRCQKHTSERVGAEPWSGSRGESESDRAARASAIARSATLGHARRAANGARPARANTWLNHVNFVFPNKTFFSMRSIVVEHWDTQRLLFF